MGLAIVDNTATIKRIVADHFELTPAHLESPRRTAELARPRQIAMVLARELLPRKSLPDIGRAFGNRDHTTVMHAVRAVARRRADDASYDATYLALRTECETELKHEDDDEQTAARDAAERLVERIVGQIRIGLLQVALERPKEFVECVNARVPMPRHPQPEERATPARDVPVGQSWAFPPEGKPTLEPTISATRRALEARHATKSIGKERPWPVKPDFRAGTTSPTKAGA